MSSPTTFDRDKGNEPCRSKNSDIFSSCHISNVSKYCSEGMWLMSWPKGCWSYLRISILYFFEIWMYLDMFKKGSLSIFNAICKTFQGSDKNYWELLNNTLQKCKRSTISFLHLFLPKRGHFYRGIYLYAKIERRSQFWKSKCTLTTTPAKKAPSSRFSNTTPPFHLIIW